MLDVITDEQLLAARGGDREAREIVMTWVYRLTAPYVRSQLPDRDQENVHQQALKKILEQMAKKGPDNAEAFQRWALVYTRTEIRAFRRKRKRELDRYAHDFDVELEPAPSTPLPERLHKFRLLRLLSRFLRSLPQLYRSPLMHHLCDGRDTSFATKHEIAKTTVRWRRHHARKLLQDMFRTYFGLSSSSNLSMLESHEPQRT